MSIKLEDCKLISNMGYLDLVDPLFVGQTRADNNGQYYMVWLSKGVLYKTLNSINIEEEFDECIDGEFSV